MKSRKFAIMLGIGLVSAMLLPTEGARGAFPGSNGRIVFFAGSPAEVDIYSMRPNGSRMKHLTTAQDPDTDPAYSPNGKMIV
jgi:Tol biopolymer transport system component